MRLNKRFLFFLLPILVFAPLDHYASENERDFQYAAHPFKISNIKEHIVPIDMDGDGRTDLVCSSERMISIYFNHMDETGSNEVFNFSTPDISLTLPGESAGWDIDYVFTEERDKTNRPKQLIALVDGTSVITWPVENRKFNKPVKVLDNLPGFLPKGAFPLNFIRDINDDGLMDIMLPGYGKLHIYLQDDKGNYHGNITINSGIGVKSNLNPSSNLDEKMGQSLTIPALNLRDVNNDGQNDLISKVDEVTEIFLGQKDGSFPLEPAYTIDLNKMLGPPKEVSPESIDFSNIFSMLPFGRQQIIADINDDKIEDLILLNYGKVTIFNGIPEGMDLSAPTQVLKSSGNVLAAFVTNYFSDGNDSNDLVLVRAQDISLGDIVSMVVFKRDINIEGYIYKNTGNVFDKRPGSKLTLTIKMPSFIKMYDMIKEIEKMEANPGNTRLIQASLRNNESAIDQVMLKENRLQFFLGEPKTEEQKKDQLNKLMGFLGEHGFLKNKNHYTIDAEKLFKSLPELEKEGVSFAVKDQEAVFSIDISSYITNTIENKEALKMDIAALDLNGDKRDDILLFTDRDETSLYGTLFISH